MVITFKEYKEARNEAINIYSNGNNKCSVCGEEKLTKLNVVPINPNIITKGKHKNGLSYTLKRLNYPTGFRVLCVDCINRQINTIDAPLLDCNYMLDRVTVK